MSEMTKGEAVGIAVTLLFSAIGIAVAISAGVLGWSLLSLPAIAVALSLNRANGRIIAGRQNGAKGFIIAFLVALPINTVFAGLFYGLGYIVSDVFA